MQQHPLLADGLVSTDGRSLAFADNAHLFNWPGALVYGRTEAMASDDPDVFEKLKTWDRERYRAKTTQAPYVDRDRPLDRERPAPAQSPRTLREQYLQPRRVNPVEVSPNNPQFARGNEAAAFEARRNRDRWMAQGREIDNAVLNKLGIKTLAADWPEVSHATPTFMEGGQWMLDAIAQNFFEGSMVPPALLKEAGPRQCGLLLASYIQSERAIEIVERFQESLWASLGRRLDEKLSQVRQELFTWARAGQLPVSRPEGGIDPALTLANAITATVGIYHLANLGRALHDFKATGQMALQGVLEGLTDK